MPPGTSSPADRCRRCFLVADRCLCRELPTIETYLEFWIVRHAREASKASNSGRLAALVIPTCRVLAFGERHRPFDEGALEGAAWLLFPPELDAQGRETGRHTVLRGDVGPPPGPVVVLDGTWGQARRMSHRIRALDALPRYQLEPGPPPQRRVRKAPRPGALATFEAIARMVERFDDPAKARVLDELYLDWGRRVRNTRPEEGVEPWRPGAPVPAW